jgi:O-antigen ligase
LSTVADSTGALEGRRQYSLSIAKLQRAVLFLFVLCSCIAVIEPSPYEVMFLVTVFVFLITGLRINQLVLPLIGLLLLYNIGGVFALIPFMDEGLSVRFIAVSVYLMFTAFLFAALMSDDALRRLDVMRAGLTCAAWVAAAAAIAGYFNIAGLGPYLTLNGRASGTFKDPNVLGPYLVIPVVMIIQMILIRRMGLIRGLLLMSLPVFAIFLSFSRGAWANFVGATLVMFVLTFVTASSAAQRARVAGFAMLIGGAAVLALLIALSFEDIRDLFFERAVLIQHYDAGVQGRFGSQLRSIPMLLEMPNGMGPLRYRFTFPEDPHNTFINAFASYGWLGGVAWIGLFCATMIAGFQLVFRRAETQGYAIALWSVLFITLLQGIQIDIDHWRHVYFLLGIVWGLRAIAPPTSRA